MTTTRLSCKLDGCTIPSLLVLFLYFNIVVRVTALYGISTLIDLMIIILPLCCLVVSVLPALMDRLLFVFGLSFFLFGFRPYDAESQVFELIVTLMVSTLLVINMTTRSSAKINAHLCVLMLSYLCLSVSSILLFPISEIAANIYHFGIADFFSNAFNAVPSSGIYIVAGLNRLLLFFVFSFQIAVSRDNRRYLNSLFLGIFISAVIASIIGMLDIYEVIDLSWYRHDTSNYLQLHSTFLNRGWFSEFIVIAIPFCLILFISKRDSLIWTVMLFGSLIICEIALLLSGARAGWVSYPLVLLICWAFVYVYKDKNFSFRRIRTIDYIKVIVSMPITIVISILILYLLLGPLSQVQTQSPPIVMEERASSAEGPPALDAAPETTPGRSKEIQSNLAWQLSRLFSAEGRIEVWKHGLAVGFEKPLFGMGYDAFSWHGNILTNIKDSYYHRLTSGRVQDTPHNIFIQLFDSGGIVGLIIWVCMMGYALMILMVDFIRNKTLINAAIIVSLLSVHFIGIFQSIQYIPMIWFLVFINYGYALTIDENVISRQGITIWNKVSLILLAVSCVSGFIYHQTSFSRTIQKKYQLEKYSLVTEHSDYPGFYNPETWDDGIYRWTGKHGAIIMKAKSDIIESRLVVHHHNSSSAEGLELKMYLNDEPLDTIHFFGGGQKTIVYHCPNITNQEIKVAFRVNKTFNPRKMGLSEDTRNLGIAVREIRFLDDLPEGFTGFYSEERNEDKSIRGLFPDMPSSFQWSGLRSSINMTPFVDQFYHHSESAPFVEGSKEHDQRKIRFHVFLRCGHPDIRKKPVSVQLVIGNRKINEILFHDNDWKKVVVEETRPAASPVLTFQVSRTWNPMLSSVSGDNRDLGVAVAIGEKNTKF
ncbi:MAG: O-antigen ligase family protein [Pseudomonadota bacterium]